MEEWRPIKDYPGYEVSSQGRIRSIDRKVKSRYGNMRLIKGKILNQRLGDNGYPQLFLYQNGKQRMNDVHRLVAEAYLENPNNYRYVDHLNTIRKDNRVENLCWVSAKGNSNNPITREHHLHTSRNKAVIQYDQNMNFIAEYESVQAAARSTGISRSHIGEVCNLGKYRKTAGGYIWKFKDEKDGKF